MSLTLKSFLADVYAPLKGICGQTETLYRLTIEAFSKSLGHDATLDDLEELKVARFISHRLRERKPATVAKDRSQLRALWELAARRRMVETWPAIARVKVPERVPEAWVEDEMESLLESASQEQTEYCGIPARLWWRALLLVCYDTGERIGAVTSLRWRDVRKNAIVFRAENRKGGRRDSFATLKVETVAALLAIRRADDELVFPWPRSKGYLWRRLEIILKRANLPHDRTCKFHKIRKTTASYSAAAGLSAQEVLDHSDPKVTRRYLDPRIAIKKHASDVLPTLRGAV